MTKSDASLSLYNPLNWFLSLLCITIRTWSWLGLQKPLSLADQPNSLLKPNILCSWTSYPSYNGHFQVLKKDSWSETSLSFLNTNLSPPKLYSLDRFQPWGQLKSTSSSSPETQGVYTGGHCGKYMNCRVWQRRAGRVPSALFASWRVWCQQKDSVAFMRLSLLICETAVAGHTSQGGWMACGI